MIEFDRPVLILTAAVCIPALTAVLLYVRKMKSRQSAHTRTVSRAWMWAAAWVCAAAALAGPYWGYETVPVQKRGHAVSFVFDISYSMTASDVPPGSGSDRLSSAAQYAESLLLRMNESAVSAVIVKGKAFTAVPLTEDFEAVRSLLPALSPALMTAPGSSPAAGIEQALLSFPEAAAQHCSIIVFTDGGGFDAETENAVRTALMGGVYVVCVGFGSEQGAYIISGGGEKIHTKLEQKLITQTLAAAQKQKGKAVFPPVQSLIGSGPAGGNSAAGNCSRVSAHFIPASQKGSLEKVLSVIGRKNNAGRAAETGFETRPVARHQFFLKAAVLFFIAGFIFSLQFKTKKSSLRKKSAILAVLCLLFTSCSEDFKNGAAVLQGTLYWHQKDYEHAVSSFSKAVSSADSEDAARQYALLGLASTYFMQGESEAALEKVEQISPGASKSVLAAAYYNGALALHASGKYDQAASYFKKSLENDNTNIDAKINYELALIQRDPPARQGAQDVIPVSEINDANGKEDTIFSIIRQNEEKRWKNSAVQNEKTQPSDY